MVRSIFSIFIIKKYHCTPLVHMICYSYFFFQIFFAFPRVNTLKNWLRCIRIYHQFDATLFPRSVCVLSIWSDTSASSAWSPFSPPLLTCSICSGHSPSLLLSLHPGIPHYHPGGSLLLFLHLAPLFPGYAVPYLPVLLSLAIAVTVTMKRKCLRICVSENVLSPSSCLKALLYMELWVRNNFLSNYENVSLTSSFHCCWKVQNYSYSCSLYITCLSISLWLTCNFFMRFLIMGLFFIHYAWPLVGLFNVEICVAQLWEVFLNCLISSLLFVLFHLSEASINQILDLLDWSSDFSFFFPSLSFLLCSSQFIFQSLYRVFIFLISKNSFVFIVLFIYFFCSNLYLSYKSNITSYLW